MFQLDQQLQDVAQDVEQCSPHLEEECEEGSLAAVACRLYKLPVALKDDGGKTRFDLSETPKESRRYFKNPHCALCSGTVRNTSRLSCVSQLVHLVQPRCHFTMAPVLSLLLDFSGATDLGFRCALFVTSFYSSRCESGQFYDTLAGQCFSIRCGFFYKNVGGRRVWKIIWTNHLQTQVCQEEHNRGGDQAHCEERLLPSPS